MSKSIGRLKHKTGLFFFISTIFFLVIAGSLILSGATASMPEREKEGRGGSEKARRVAQEARKRRAALLGEASPAKRRTERRTAGSLLAESPEKRVEREENETRPSLLEQVSERYDKPREAAEYFRMKRVPEGEKDVPVEKYFEAQRQMLGMPHFSTSLNRMMSQSEWLTAPQSAAALHPDAAAWTPLGPGNIGGRTRALLINPQDPNVIFAAGVSGGVWKTTNGGVSWTPISDLIGNITVSSMAMEPGNPNTIYIGTGEGVAEFSQDTLGDFRGAGIFKTIDGGTTWTRLANTATEDFYFVNDLVISPNDKNRIYAATRTGVWRSNNAGVDWTKVLDPLNEDGETTLGGCLDLAIRMDQTTDFIFAACGTFEQSRIYRNTDAAGAGTWSAVVSEPGMGRTALAIAPSNQNIVYALASSVEDSPYQLALYAVFRSTDSGASGSWTKQVSNTSLNKLNTALLSIPPLALTTDCGFGERDDFFGQGWYDLVIAVDPVDQNRVWVGGIDLFRSDDGGVNWGVAGPVYVGSNFDLGPIHPDQHTIVFHPQYNGGTNQQMFVGNDGGLFKTENARGSVATSIQAVCGAAIVGVTWKKLNNNYGVTQFYFGLPSPDGKTYFGGTQDNGTILGTDAAGINGWKEINGGDGGYVAVDPNNPSTLYAEFTSISIRKSSDNGGTFGGATAGINDSGLFISPFVMDPSEPQRLWTGGDYLWRTTNGGARWTRASALTAGASQVSAIAIAPTDANRALVGMGDGYILRNDAALTTTSTTSWSNVRPRRGFVSSLTFDPNNKDIAYATYSTFDSAHVWRTTDGGATWTAIDGTGTGEIPNVPVHSLAIDPSNTARLYVGTDVGVFVSTNGGTSWAVENTGFANVITEALQLNVVDGVTTLYAFTHGRGAWRVMINNSGCKYGLSPATQNLKAGAGSGTINVAAAPNGCSWTSAGNAAWLKVNGSGSSNSAATFTVDENTTFRSRTGTAMIAGRSFTVTQEGRADLDVPVVVITDPVVPQPAVNRTGLINLAGTAKDNNAVAAVTWTTSRGLSGNAVLGSDGEKWTAANVPLGPGVNLITITARDAVGNLGRAFLNLNSLPDSLLVTVAGAGVRGLSGDGGQAVNAQMTRPIRIDIDGAGNLYLTDSDNNTIRKVAPNGVITTVAGNATRGFSGDGGPATLAQLSFPIGVAVDSSGNLYICDNGNSRIRKVTAATGVISTVAGNGTAGFSGDGGPGTAAQINTAQNVAVDKDGSVYISDFGNNRVRKVTVSTGVISTVAGAGTAGFSGDGGLATAAQLNSPNNVSVDKDGNLIICDPGNNRIRKVTASTGVISTIVGKGTSGFGGDGGPAIDALVAVPVGAIVDQAGNLLFSDRSNQRVRKVAVGTNIITTIVGTGDFGFNGEGLPVLASTLNFPTGLALDPAGNLYIGDRDNGRVRKLLTVSGNDTTAPTIAITAPTTSPAFTTSNVVFNLDGTAADNNVVFQVRWSNDRGGSGVAAGTTSWSVKNIPLQAGLNNLTVTAWDVNGNAASARLAVTFTPAQIISTIAGTGVEGNTGDGGAAVAARLSFPSGIALDAGGNLYIAESGNHRVRKVSPAGVITAFAGNGMLGSGGDGGQATEASMNQPTSVAIDTAGNVYIADNGNNRIRRVAPNGVITTYAGTGADGFAGDGGPAAQAQLNAPIGIAVDSAGNLFIADGNNARVRKVTAATGVITTVAGDGRIGFGGDGGQATKAQFRFPFGVTVDRSGVLYVVDGSDNRVRRISPDGVISTYVGNGDPGFSGDGGPAKDARIAFPSYISTDADGNLHIADFENHRIRKVTLSTGIITTVVGTGVAGSGGDGSAPTAAQLSFPNDVQFDRAGNMYIADYNNQRIRKILRTGTISVFASVSAASYLNNGLASESIAGAFGINLATATVLANTVPLPTSLAGTTVRVRDALGVERLAPLFFVSSAQINFQVPPSTAIGAATITIASGDGIISTSVAQIAVVGPGLFSANSDGQGVAAAVVLRVKANGQQIFEPVSRLDPTTNKFVSVPIDLGPESDQVFLLLFGTASRYRSSLAASSVTVGGGAAELLFVGAQGDFIGLDQINLRLGRNLIGRGEVDVILTLDGKPSNAVKINVK